MNELGLPIYKVVLNSEDDGMDFNSFVDFPATKKGAFYFGEEKIHHFSADEKRIVTGVAIAANVPIFRRDRNGNEYRVFFTPEVVRELGRRMMKRGYMHNINSMHDSNKQIKGATLDEIYYIGDGHEVPALFKNQNLQAGTMMVSYHIENDKEWAKWKNGEYQGFSIEAWFDIEKVNFKNQNKMQKKEKSFLEHIKGFFTEVEVPVEKVFTESKTASGETMKWEGDLAVGIPVFLVTEESDIVASEGIYSLPELNILVTVDADGLVANIEEVEADEAVEEVIEEMAKQFQSFSTNQKSEVLKLHAKIDEQNKKIENLFALINTEKKQVITPSKTWRNAK